MKSYASAVVVIITVDMDTSGEYWTVQSDAELVRWAQCGNDDALVCLIERYESSVSEAVAAVATADTVEILQQEGMLGLFLAVRNFSVARLQTIDADVSSELMPFSEFANTCVCNRLERCLKNLDSAYITAGRGECARESHHGADVKGQLVEEELPLAVQQRVRRDLSRLETQVFDLYLEGQSYQEIAASLQRRVKSVDNALYRIRTKLSKVLAERK